MNKKLLGVLGGLGPTASARFYFLLTEFTKASCDQEHIDMIMCSIPSVPDRTAFIKDNNNQDPLPSLKRYIRLLLDMGVDIISIPCNTAEYFYYELQKIIKVPIIKTSFETVSFAVNSGATKVGIMATEGALKSNIYQKACERFNLKYEILSKKAQDILNKIIYEKIKKSLSPNICDFLYVAEELYSKGCDFIILGCTELSLIPYSDIFKKYNFIDSLTVLAIKSVELCGYDLSDVAKEYIKIKRSGTRNENIRFTYLGNRIFPFL